MLFVVVVIFRFVCVLMFLSLYLSVLYIIYNCAFVQRKTYVLSNNLYTYIFNLLNEKKNIFPIDENIIA